MRQDISFRGVVPQFRGVGGWFYVAVPKKHTKQLKAMRRVWGMYAITASVGHTSWKTKLMMKKGGDFFVALRADIRRKEGIKQGDTIRVSFRID